MADHANPIALPGIRWSAAPWSSRTESASLIRPEWSDRSVVKHAAVPEAPLHTPCISGAYRACLGWDCRGWDAVPLRQTTSEGCDAQNGVLALATVQFMETL